MSDDLEPGVRRTTALEAARIVVSGKIACSTLEETLARAYLDLAERSERITKVLRLVQKGLRSGHIEDQTIIDTSDPDAEEARLDALSDIVNAALAPATPETGRQP